MPFTIWLLITLLSSGLSFKLLQNYGSRWCIHGASIRLIKSSHMMTINLSNNPDYLFSKYLTVDFNAFITSDIQKKLSQIDECKHELHSGINCLSEDFLFSLQKEANIQSIGSSTIIEGSDLTDNQVDVLLSTSIDTSSLSRYESEVYGYSEALSWSLMQSSVHRESYNSTGSLPFLSIGGGAVKLDENN